MAIQKNDVVTAQLPGMPGKRGRPATGKAKSAAQRVREHRARKRTSVPQVLTVPISGEVLDALRFIEGKFKESNGDLAPNLLELVDIALRCKLASWGISFAGDTPTFGGHPLGEK